MAVIINNKKYYRISEISKISGVKNRTLRRWIDRGELDHFLHAFKADGRALMFRLEPPTEDDLFYSEEKNIYLLPNEKEVG